MTLFEAKNIYQEYLLLQTGGVFYSIFCLVMVPLLIYNTKPKAFLDPF